MKRNESKKSTLKSLVMFIAAVAAVLAAIKVVVSKLYKTNNAAEQLNIKDIFVFIGRKKCGFAEKISRGAIITSYLGSVDCDFSACEFEHDSFVTIKTVAGKVNVIMPENVNVKFDFVNSGSFIKWNVEDDGFISGRPTVYVALKTAFSYVNIEK